MGREVGTVFKNSATDGITYVLRVQGWKSVQQSRPSTAIICRILPMVTGLNDFDGSSGQGCLMEGSVVDNEFLA